jgi:hypothetical protein
LISPKESDRFISLKDLSCSLSPISLTTSRPSILITDALFNDETLHLLDDEDEDAKSLSGDLRNDDACDTEST